MTFVQIQQVLLWSAILNYALLISWWAILRLPHSWLYRLSAKPFNISEDLFDAMNLAGIGLYKMAILCLFAVPYIAMRIVGG